MPLLKEFINQNNLEVIGEGLLSGLETISKPGQKFLSLLTGIEPIGTHRQEFPLGEGLTPEQKTRAEEITKRPLTPTEETLPEAQVKGGLLAPFTGRVKEESFLLGESLKRPLSSFEKQRFAQLQEERAKEAPFAVGLLAPKAIGEVPVPSIKPPVPLTPIEKLPSPIEPISDPVQKVIQALKEAKPIREQQETIFSKERGERLAKALAVGEKVKGEKGFFTQLGQLKGELPKVQFESLRDKISQEDIDNLFQTARDHPSLVGFEKITAQEGLAKLFGQYGGRVPTEGELKLLDQVFPKELVDELLAKRPLWDKFKEAGLQLANIPRSLMSSFLDLSFGGRQGAFAAPIFRKEFADSWGKQFKIFGSEKAYQASREVLLTHPNYELAKEAGISFTDLGRIMTEREERFASQWAEKIPFIGKGVRATSRAYTAFANKFRMDIFSSMIRDAEKVGLNPRENVDQLKEIARFVNTATGRGSLGGLERAATALNTFFFSPRLMASRLTLLNPLYYIRADPFVRKTALKSLFAFAGTITTALTLAKLAGANVGTNPNSADFGKIKIGNTRIDIMAGFQQYIRAASQLMSGKYVSSVTGKEITLGKGFKSLSRFDILGRQIESKEAPVASFITDILRQQDFQGQPINVPKEIGQRLIPMMSEDLVAVAKEDPALLAITVPLGIFGAGIQTYKPKIGKSTLGLPSLPGFNLPSLPGL